MPVGIDPQQIGLEMGSGAVIGGVVGFAAKKVAKLLAIIVGLELALFKFLESRGVLSVDWSKLSAGFLKTSQAAQANSPPPWIATVISTLSISGGFVGGFMLGFKKG